MPCPFTGPKMFCASPNFLSQPKNLTAFSASSKTFVLAQKPILLNANHIFVWHKMPQYVNRFLGWLKKFGPAQDILGPVKRQGISINKPSRIHCFILIPFSVSKIFCNKLFSSFANLFLLPHLISGNILAKMCSTFILKALWPLSYIII